MKSEPTRIRRLGLAGIFLVVLHLLMPAVAGAGVAVSPLQQWVDVKPGKTADFSLTVTNVKRNENTPPEFFRVRLVDFSVSHEGKLSFHEKLEHERSARDWIDMEDGEFMLKPNESKKITGTISAPLAAGGDYWAAVMVTLGRRRKNEDGVRVVLRTASGLFVHVGRRNYLARSSFTDTKIQLPSPDPDRDTGKAEAEAKKDSQEQPAFRIDAAVKNDGKVAFSGKATAHLYDENRRRIASIPMHAQRKRLLPGHRRRFRGVMAMPLPAGSYRLRIICEAARRHGRKTMVEKHFDVASSIAKYWSDHSHIGSTDGPLKTDQQNLELKLSPGRFSIGQLKLTNQSLDTLSVRCELQTDSLPAEWVNIRSKELTLPPRMARNLACSARIPPDATPGRYKGSLKLHIELPAASEESVVQNIPLTVEVTKADAQS